MLAAGGNDVLHFVGLRTCCATRPPSWLLSFTYLSTAELRKLSNSSTDSGSGSTASLGGAAAAAAGGVETVVSAGGEAIGGFESRASLGASVEEAISSSRDVAASRLTKN